MSEILKKKPGPSKNKDRIYVKVTDASKKEEIPYKEITSIEMFFSEVLYLQERGFSFFRGDKKSNDYKLIPNIYKENNYELSDLEDIMIDEFTSLSANKNQYNTNKYIEEMLMAQHYDLPTRLQDWSESALTALYFAVYEEDESKRISDSYLWALNPKELNRHIKFLNPKKPVPNIIASSNEEDVGEQIVKHYVNENKSDEDIYPIALNAKKINSRIEAQRGVFVLFPRQDKFNCKCLSKFPDSAEYLYRMDIKLDIAAKFLKYLISAGISQYLLFPEMQSIAKDIKVKYGRKAR